MYVLDVIPFSKSAPQGTLSYRSTKKLQPGALVSVTLRRTPIQGVVVDCATVAERKSELKRASFTLASSDPVEEGALSKELMEAARMVALYHATSVGLVLTALIGEYVRAEVLFPKQKKVRAYTTLPTTIEAELATRKEVYRKAIQDVVSHGDTVQLIVPSLAELIYWQTYFSDLKPLCIAGTTTPKKRAVLFAQAREYTGLVITTPAHEWLPLAHRALTILERVSAGTYQAVTRPYLDYRIAARERARSAQEALLVGDFPLPLEYRPHPDAPLASTSTSVVSVVDVRSPKDAPEKKVWKAVSDELLAEIRAALQGKAPVHIAVLAVRKGYAPAVVCKDCGQTVTDERGRTLSFSVEQGVRVLRSNDGHTVQSATTLCTRCGSWNLLPLGIGIERVEEELRAVFTDTPIVSFAAETIRSHAHVQKLLHPLLDTSCIVVGTEAMLPWLQVSEKEFPLTLSVVASSDSLLALPFWRARERFLRLVFLFGSLSKKLVIATRHPEDTVFETFSERGTGAFFKEETALRTALSYPPFGTLVTLTIEGSRTHVALVHEDIAPTIQGYAFIQLPDRPVSSAGYKRTLVYRAKKDEWPNEALVSALRTLPQSVKVRIDTELL